MAQIFTALDVGSRPEQSLDDKIVCVYRDRLPSAISLARYHLFDVSGEATLIMDKHDETGNKSLFVNLLSCCWYDTASLFAAHGNDSGIVQIYFRYLDKAYRKIYVMGGYFFDPAVHSKSTGKIPFTDFLLSPASLSAHAAVTPAARAASFTIPVFVLPNREHTAKIDMKIIRVTNIIKSLFVLLSCSDDVPPVCPTGNSMYSFEAESLGVVSPDEEELAINVYIGSICHSTHAVNIAATSFADLVMRCCDIDPTFFRRLIAHNPSYRECTAPVHVRDKIKSVIVAKAKDYTAVKMPCAISRLGHVLKSVIE